MFLINEIFPENFYKCIELEEDYVFFERKYLCHYVLEKFDKDFS